MLFGYGHVYGLHGSMGICALAPVKEATSKPSYRTKDRASLQKIHIENLV